MGAAAAIFGVVLSTVVVPLPEELALLGAGWVAHSGSISLFGAWLAGWSAIVVGDIVSYLIGRSFLDPLLETRLGKRIISPEMRRWGEDFVRRRGVSAILLGRFLVALRGPVYLAIGASKVPFLRFLAIDAAIAVVEVGIFVYLGYLFGQSHKLANEMRWVEIAIGLSILAVLVLPALLKRRLQRRHAVAA